MGVCNSTPGYGLIGRKPTQLPLCKDTSFAMREAGRVLSVTREQRPYDASIFVGESDGGDIVVTTLQQLLKPRVAALIRLALKRSHRRSCPVDQQSSQVGVAALI